MPKPIIWSPLSEKDFIYILDYLQTTWNDKVARDFIEITESAVSQIAANPKISKPISPDRMTRVHPISCISLAPNPVRFRKLDRVKAPITD